MGFLAAVLLHLVLATLAGNIPWALPWSDRFFHLITVRHAHSHWVLNFLLHPVAFIEIAIIAAAAVLWRKNQRLTPS
jgi:inner membrane protein